MSGLVKIGTWAGSWLSCLLRAWHRQVSSNIQAAHRAASQLGRKVSCLSQCFFYPTFTVSYAQLRLFRNLPALLAALFFFTLLTDDFIRLQTVGQLPDGATSLVSLSIPGEISNPRQMQRLLASTAGACASQGYVPCLASSSCFPGSFLWPCSNAMFYWRNYLKWCWHPCLILIPSFDSPPAPLKTICFYQTFCVFFDAHILSAWWIGSQH